MNRHVFQLDSYTLSNQVDNGVVFYAAQVVSERLWVILSKPTTSGHV